MPVHRSLMYGVKTICQASLSLFLLAIFCLENWQMEIASSAQHLCHW